MALTLTDPAVDRLAQLLKQGSSPERWLRIAIRGGGCSGFTYMMDFVDTPSDGDKRFEFRDDVRVCVDKKSYLFLNGTEIDFQKSLVKTGFVFNNPMAQGTCSCGESFSI